MLYALFLIITGLYGAFSKSTIRSGELYDGEVIDYKFSKGYLVRFKYNDTTLELWTIEAGIGLSNDEIGKNIIIYYNEGSNKCSLESSGYTRDVVLLMTGVILVVLNL
ncbi:hypothetical protein [Fusobacterium sp. PH5-44]|uniref:hypothetical protein n=1 Tax=unclassified Fusobacterium TaxID=2648384 RepID=UPI003D1F2FAA